VKQCAVVKSSYCLLRLRWNTGLFTFVECTSPVSLFLAY
jgi:hypothetical protein